MIESLIARDDEELVPLARLQTVHHGRRGALSHVEVLVAAEDVNRGGIFADLLVVDFVLLYGVVLLGHLDRVPLQSDLRTQLHGESHSDCSLQQVTDIIFTVVGLSISRGNSEVGVQAFVI